MDIMYVTCVVICILALLRGSQPQSQLNILSTGQFLIPIRWHGPNNQITEIKETISMSYLLPGSTAVVPNLQEHRFSDGASHEMLSKELFDFDILQKGNASYLLLDDLRKSWNGELDAILYMRDESFPQVPSMVKEMGLKAPGHEKWLRSPVSVYRGCSMEQVQELRKLLSPYRYVGFLCYDDFALQTHKLAGTLLSTCGDACCQAYKDRSKLLHKSPALYELAGRWIASAVGRNTPFVAGHIRPMPDECVELWQIPTPELSEDELHRICRTDYMYTRFVPNLQALMHIYNVSTVFIMTHPYIRPRVFRMLRAAGIHPVYIDTLHLNSSIAASPNPLRTPLSFSLLAMVEEAVAVAATAFLGTAESSMTGMVVQERISLGLSPQDIYYMAPHRDCTLVPCKLEDYYVRRDSRLKRRPDAGCTLFGNSTLPCRHRVAHP